MSDVVTIRPARADDRPVLVTMMAALQEFERGIACDRAPGADMADGHLAYLQALAADGGAVLVAESGGQAVGFLVCVVERCDAGDLHLLESERRAGYVTDLYVAAGARRRGVGRALLAEAERHCRSVGLRTLRITSLATNDAAMRAYEAAGFTSYEVTLSKRL